MSKENKPILYKIYYGDLLVYLGRTKQPLQNRLRGHFFKKPMHRAIDINHVTKIEYAEFQTVADMYLYEIYYINKLKPSLNVDDLARDEITVTLSEVEFLPYNCHLFESWKNQINANDTEWDRLHKEYCNIPLQQTLLRKQKRNGEITEEEYYEQHESLSQREKELCKQLYGYEKLQPDIL